jgi:DNA-binding MarR family transcriptional regulator
MKKLLILVLFLAVVDSASARNTDAQAINSAKVKWENLTPEQQQQVRAQAEEIYKNMSPEERAQLEDKANMLSRKQKKTLKSF